MTFTNWIDTFCEEKGFDMERGFEVEGPSGTNHMNYEVVVSAMKSAPAHEQEKIKATLVKIDFMNGDCLHFFRHLAQAIAI
jgi:hypothetical protein